MVDSLFDTHKTYGYIVISSVIATLKGTEKKILKKVQGDLTTETRRIGQSANLIARIKQEKRDNYKDRIISASFMLQGVEGVIVGGNAELPKEVLEKIRGDTRLSFNVLGFVKTSSTNINVSLNEAIKASESIILGKICTEENNEILNVQDIITNNPDKIVFGDMIKTCDDEFLLDYILVRKGMINKQDWNCDIREIIHSKFLDAYNGIVGILYYSGIANHLQN